MGLRGAIINPSETTFSIWKGRHTTQKLKDLVEEDVRIRTTKDGQPFQLYANADTPEEVKARLIMPVRELDSLEQKLFSLKMRCPRKMFNFRIIVN